MFRSWYRTVVNRPSRLSLRGRRPKTRLRLETLEDRCLLSGTVTITSLQGPSTTSAAVPVATEGAPANPSVNATFTDTNAVTPANLTVTVNYGDGTLLQSNQAGPNFDANLLITQVGGAGGTTYTITDQHTFPEESGSTVPPFAFTLTLTVTENANAANTATTTGSAQVLDAALSVGDPVSKGTPVVFTGGNTGNATSAAAAVSNFETAIGGVKNTAAAPQTGGFRQINWDGVKTDGTDAVAGPNSTVPIPAGSTHTVGIPLDRFQGQGVFFGAVYAVTNDGYTDVNPGAAGLFPAFSQPNVFAMFNDNGIDFKFVAPSSPSTPPVSATARGFGAVFLNVQHAGSTTIQYFSNNNLLDTLTVPASPTPGQAVFAGELFANPIITNVLLTLGDGVIFKFDGTNVTAGAANSPTNNLVAVDDWFFPEPVPAANGFPIVTGTQGTLNAKVTVNAKVGVPFNGAVATFNDLDPNGNAKDYTATINWGDGHFQNGTIAADGNGGFTVSGSNTYTHAGTFPVNVDVADFGGGPGVGGSAATESVNNTAQVTAGSSTTTLNVSPGSAGFGQPVTLTATVTGAGGAVATGTVTFFNNGKALGTVGLDATGKAVLTVTTLNPGNQGVTAVYGGDASFTGSTSAPASVTISPDVTSQVSVNVGKAKRHGNRFRRVVTLKNTGGNFIPAPLLLVLDHLTAGAQVFGAAGTTKFLPPLGDPFVAVDLGGASVLAPGGSVTVNLDFTGKAARKATFTARVLAGTTQV
jgi:hypothetical protein